MLIEEEKETHHKVVAEDLQEEDLQVVVHTEDLQGEDLQDEDHQEVDNNGCYKKIWFGFIKRCWKAS